MFKKLLLVPVLMSCARVSQFYPCDKKYPRPHNMAGRNNGEKYSEYLNTEDRNIVTKIVDIWQEEDFDLTDMSRQLDDPNIDIAAVDKKHQNALHILLEGCYVREAEEIEAQIAILQAK